MKTRLFIIIIAIFATMSAAARSSWFSKGKYGISNVANQANLDQKTSDPSTLWIEIEENTVKIVDSPKNFIFTPEFGEGESLDLTMKPVESPKTVIEYKIVEFKTLEDGNGHSEDICILKNADGELCSMRSGVIGKTKDGDDVYAFNIDDNQFKEIFWIFIAEDVVTYE